MNPRSASNSVGRSRGGCFLRWGSWFSFGGGEDEADLGIPRRLRRLGRLAARGHGLDLVLRIGGAAGGRGATGKPEAAMLTRLDEIRARLAAIGFLVLCGGCACASLPWVQLGEHSVRDTRGIVPFCWEVCSAETKALCELYHGGGDKLCQGKP